MHFFVMISIRKSYDGSHRKNEFISQDLTTKQIG
jgi:hypothetical protein